ncbi:hypothetical protein [Thalassotalea crassostreae]|nr:hypothetical protein [Thalassotalea crassostreae]
MLKNCYIDESIATLVDVHNEFKAYVVTLEYEIYVTTAEYQQN